MLIQPSNARSILFNFFHKFNNKSKTCWVCTAFMIQHRFVLWKGVHQSCPSAVSMEEKKSRNGRTLGCTVTAPRVTFSDYSDWSSNMLTILERIMSATAAEPRAICAPESRSNRYTNNRSAVSGVCRGVCQECDGGSLPPVVAAVPEPQIHRRLVSFHLISRVTPPFASASCKTVG